MGLFGNFFAGGEAITLQKEFEEIKPYLDGIYRGPHFYNFFKTYRELEDEANSSVGNMTEKGAKEYFHSILFRGKEIINHNLAVRSAQIMFAVFHRSTMLDNETAAQTKADIKYQLYLINLLTDALHSSSSN